MAQTPESTRLVVVGDGPEATALRVQADRLGVTDRVVFAGRRTRDDVTAALAAADVFVFPAREVAREGLPLAVLEALAVGLPVLVPVGSRWPDDLSAVFDVVDMNDPEELARQIAEAASRRSSVSLLPRRYCADGMRDAYQALLGELLRGRGRCGQGRTPTGRVGVPVRVDSHDDRGRCHSDGTPE